MDAEHAFVAVPNFLCTSCGNTPFTFAAKNPMDDGAFVVVCRTHDCPYFDIAFRFPFDRNLQLNKALPSEIEELDKANKTRPATHSSGWRWRGPWGSQV